MDHRSFGARERREFPLCDFTVTAASIILHYQLSHCHLKFHEKVFKLQVNTKA